VDNSLNLGNLLYTIASTQTLSKSKTPLFQQALQQYSLTNFTLQILAYCSEEELVEKEQYYLQLYQPEYNRLEDKPIIDISITKSPASLSAINTLDKQLVLFESAITQLTKINQPPTLSLTKLETKFIEDKEHLKNIPPDPKEREICKASLKESILEVKTKKTWTLSETTRRKQSIAQQKRTKHPKLGLAVQVLDLSNNSTIIYSSLREASRALNIRVEIISKYLSRKQSKPYKKRYIFTKFLKF